MAIYNYGIGLFFRWMRFSCRGFKSGIQLLITLRPPVLLTYWPYWLMVAAAGWMLLVTIAGAYLLARGKLYNCRIFLYTMFFSTLIPVLVNELGWLAAEFGRQPWIVYDLLKTEAASSPI